MGALRNRSIHSIFFHLASWRNNGQHYHHGQQPQDRSSPIVSLLSKCVLHYSTTFSNYILSKQPKLAPSLSPQSTIFPISVDFDLKCIISAICLTTRSYQIIRFKATCCAGFLTAKLLINGRFLCVCVFLMFHCLDCISHTIGQLLNLYIQFLSSHVGPSSYCKINKLLDWREFCYIIFMVQRSSSNTSRQNLAGEYWLHKTVACKNVVFFPVYKSVPKMSACSGHSTQTKQRFLKKFMDDHGFSSP